MKFLDVLRKETAMNGQMRMEFEEFIAYNNELATYIDIEKFSSSSRIINEILDASNSIKLIKPPLDDVAEFRNETNHESTVAANVLSFDIVTGTTTPYRPLRNVEILNGSLSDIEKIREEIEVEFHSINEILKKKFRYMETDLTSEYIMNAIQSSNNLINYTINKLIKKYEGSEYKFNYAIVTNIHDQNNPSSVRGIELILLNE